MLQLFIWEKIYTTDSFEKIHAQYNTKSKLSIFQREIVHTEKLPNWNTKACEMWKTSFFGYKMNSVFLNRCSTSNNSTNTSICFICTSFFRELHPPKTHNDLNKQSIIPYGESPCMFMKSIRNGLSCASSLIFGMWGLKFISQLSYIYIQPD